MACAVGVAAYFAGGHPGVGAGTAVARDPVTREQASACLSGQRALVSNAPSSPQFRSAPAIHVSFALVPGRRLDGMAIYFERSPSAAKDVVRKLIARLHASTPVVDSYLVAANNAVVFWDSPRISTASRAAVFGCL
jgi:hypothetical protein